jgi:signal transduction histidine kinase
MAEVTGGVQALVVLYDLALTIGSEVTLPELLSRTVQRLLYHTGFPAGLMLSPPDESGELRVDAAVGNYRLIKRVGQRMRLPGELLGEGAAFAEGPQLLESFPAARPYRFYLRLPVEDLGCILLLGYERPEAPLPWTELFLPIMARLATAIRVCRKLEQRTGELEQTNRELEAFAYSVSHDLRAPLRAIDGFSKIVLEDYGDRLDDEGRRLLGVVRLNTERMGRMIDDILRFSRTARQEMSTREVDMEKLTREVFDELSALEPPERRILLQVADLPFACGDQAMLRQVLVNLLSNAIKFTRPKAEARIEVGFVAGLAENEYFVRDNGVGFDGGLGTKLFATFQRLHSADQFEGTGIGLAIVKRIVTRHGGRVWAEGKVGEGAVVHFTLSKRKLSG